MNKKKIERTIVVFLFMLVLVVFSFAERDSKKLERIYNTVHLIEKGSPASPELAKQALSPVNSTE